MKLSKIKYCFLFVLLMNLFNVSYMSTPGNNGINYGEILIGSLAFGGIMFIACYPISFIHGRYCEWHHEKYPEMYILELERRKLDPLYKSSRDQEEINQKIAQFKRKIAEKKAQQDNKAESEKSELKELIASQNKSNNQEDFFFPEMNRQNYNVHPVLRTLYGKNFKNHSFISTRSVFGLLKKEPSRSDQRVSMYEDPFLGTYI